VQKFTILEKDFSEKEGDLTPTLKLKRSVVAKKYAALIEAMYNE
jgi:long-chain acyl-CoA synthetase